ncbi:MAG: hypothetical protein U1A78_03775 [Polyangia bacterium]
MADDKRPNTPGQRPPPELLLEKALLGELPAGTELPAGSEARLEALRSDSAAILERHPPRRIAAEIERRLGGERQPDRQPVRMWQLAWAPAALALVLVVAFGLRTRAPVGSDPAEQAGGPAGGAAGGDEVTLKGLAPELRVYRKDGRSEGHAERLRDGSAVRSGDVVQLSYLAAGQRAGLIVSIDGRGGTTLHHPATASEPALLARSGEVPLARAYKLDDAPRFERFFFVTAADPARLDVTAVLDAARRLAAAPGAEQAPLGLPAGLRQLSLLLRKEAP